MTLKQQVYESCLHVIQEKITFSNSLLIELADGAENASKSSAGDKHEVGRAMVQLEQEKIGNQLLELESQFVALQKLKNYTPTATITNGSLIGTSLGYFYLSIAAGKLTVGNQLIFALSPQSPLGNAFLGLSVGDTATFNKTSYTILEIL